MEEDRELAVLSGEDHQDLVLQRRIANGEISAEHVERVWRATEDLSAQTPFETRAAVAAMRDMGYQVTPAENMILNTVLDLRAALYRDESKFAHLVSGTETIVQSLQKANELAARVEDLTRTVFHLNAALERHRWHPVRWFLSLFKKQEQEWDPYDTDLLDDNDPIPQEDHDRMIGSSWDASNPRKA